MQIVRKTSFYLPLAWGAILFFGMVSAASAQTTDIQNSKPCQSIVLEDFTETVDVANPPVSGGIVPIGLTPVQSGAIVYDLNQGICWLADANLAGNSKAREEIHLSSTNPDGTTPVIYPDGTMNYQTALNWVSALNLFKNGKGYLGHNNWQLPDNPLDDPTCSSFNNGSFGIDCTGSALGNLYSVGLGFTYPKSVNPHFAPALPPFANMQPMLYWDSGLADHGESTFSFNTGLNGGNTTKYNYFHVLAMALGPIGAIPAGKGVLPYLSGPAEGLAVYDTKENMTWVLDANLAATEQFGVTGNKTIPSKHIGKVTVPLIDADGAMLFEAIDGRHGWLAGMNKIFYAGTNNWMLPDLSDLQKLYAHLDIQVGDPRLVAPGRVGPFKGLQAGFYWACQRDIPGDSRYPCDPTLKPPYTSHANTPYEYSFNFAEGFEGTDLETKLFYVMVYYPSEPSSIDPIVP
jgi:hypothetical protein